MKTKQQGLGNLPIQLAENITAEVNKSYIDGSFLDRATPITQELLKFWFTEPHITNRSVNFHNGQKQSILNTIYLHEIVGIKSVHETYLQFNPNLLQQTALQNELSKHKYNCPKYALNMATGTGKTWVMHALLIWQMLNAKYEKERGGKFTKNFLLVAPGIIVYERLLDAYLGKENENRRRDFERSDFYMFKELFVPPTYYDAVFGFIQNNTVKKEDIGKTTGDGMIAITNYHLFMSDEELEASETDASDPKQIADTILPITPGTSGGNVLSNLDNAYLRGKEMEFLISLPNIMVVNDEAHHIHESKRKGEINELEWQKGLDKIAKNKGTAFVQIDFTATPYNYQFKGDTGVKNYFAHIIAEFNLKSAIQEGLVKTIAIDKRKEITDIPLKYKAERLEDGVVSGLSDGQRLMLRAGLTKLKSLEDEFVKFTKESANIKNKYPKMLVMCEDTTVSSVVEKFLKDEGYGEEQVTRIDTNKSGEVSDNEWARIKQQLFNIDALDKPKVIISVLMLREGFDVNNICVIVPLRASKAHILLEQTIGRGLRLMWREGGSIQELKNENRKLLLNEKKEPNSSLDLLYIIEHPEFIKWYEDFINQGLVATVDDGKGGGGTGDLINVGLKSNNEQYDIYWPLIVHDEEERIKPINFSAEKLAPYTGFTLEQLKSIFAKHDGEDFQSEELTVGTTFGTYRVSASLFSATTYIDYLQHLLEIVTSRQVKVSERKTSLFPVFQIYKREILELLDAYIRTHLFNEPFNPFEGGNWKILLMKSGIITKHIVSELSKFLHEMEQSKEVSEPVVQHKYFSTVKTIVMREKYALNITKTIYERLAMPSNKGGFEKDFMEFADNDGLVDALLKLDVYQHNFASITYFRKDGLPAIYHPDFIVVFKGKIYIIETKADNMMDEGNVQRKRQATVSWCNRINKLKPEYRMNREWEYALLSDKTFYLYKDSLNLLDICNLSKVSVTEANIKGKLF